MIYTIQKDGNARCAMASGFINLQESLKGCDLVRELRNYRYKLAAINSRLSSMLDRIGL